MIKKTLNKQIIKLQNSIQAKNSVYIVAAKRTPIGSFMGKLSKIKSTELGGIAINGALKSINIQGSDVDEVIMGNVCQAGTGQNPARQASLNGGISINVPCTTINKVCASGMKTISLGSQSISLGLNNTVVCGGFENMSQVPYYLMNHRKGHQFGNEQLIDGLAYDGLTDVYNNIAMGLCAEKTVDQLGISRQVQDDYSISSYEKTISSIQNGRFQDEYVEVPISEKEYFNEDEEHKKYNKEKISKLRAVFSKNGTITAGNASKINDGACAFVLMSEQKVKQLKLNPLAKIISYADTEVEPIDFCIAPQDACKIALKRANMKLQNIEYHEINEAFACTVLANMKLLDLDPDRVNVNGGAVALGHPIGMSGARIVLSLISVLKQNKSKYGMASICNGGGGASAMIIENI